MLYGTLLLTATGLFSQLLGFIYRILLSRLIGAEVMGLYQLVMPVYSVLLSVTAVGLTAAVSSPIRSNRAKVSFSKRPLVSAMRIGLMLCPPYTSNSCISSAWPTCSNVPIWRSCA